MKQTLIHLSNSPYSNLSCKEGLDLALVLATFEQPVDLCLSGAALSILNNGQDPTIEQGKNLHKLLDGLAFYDIENVFIDKDSTWTKTSVSWQGVTPLDKAQWQAIFSDYQHVFRF